MAPLSPKEQAANDAIAAGEPATPAAPVGEPNVWLREPAPPATAATACCCDAGLKLEALENMLEAIGIRKEMVGRNEFQYVNRAEQELKMLRELLRQLHAAQPYSAHTHLPKETCLHCEIEAALAKGSEVRRVQS